MRFLTSFLFLLILGCQTSVDDYIQETPGGGVYVKKILTETNLITCKKVAYCQDVESAEWTECKTTEQAKQSYNTHVEVACIDLARDDDFILTLSQWDSVKHKFGEYYNEHIFELLDNLEYVIENTELFDGKAPQIEEDFKEFHYKREE